MKDHMYTPENSSRWVSGHAGAVERAGRDGRQAMVRPTCSNDFFNLDEGYIDLLGELSDCLVGILVGEGVDVDLHSWRPLLHEISEQSEKGRENKSICAMAKNWRPPCPHTLCTPTKMAAITVLTCTTSIDPYHPLWSPLFYLTLPYIPSSPPLPLFFHYYPSSSSSSLAMGSSYRRELELAGFTVRAL